MKRARGDATEDGRGFTGFPRSAVSFLAALKKNNRRDWFEGHRDQYAQDLVEPAKSFVKEMGERLRRIAPHVVADPRIGGSIFRIHRDLRFSADKTPYKTNLAILFWEGDSKLDGSGFYVSLEARELLLGSGIYIFDRQRLHCFRSAMEDRVRVAELRGVLASITRGGQYEIGGRRRKRVPIGFAASHPAADLLLHDGLYAGIHVPPPPDLHSAHFIDFCLAKFTRMAPLHRWLTALDSFQSDR